MTHSGPEPASSTSWLSQLQHVGMRTKVVVPMVLLAVGPAVLVAVLSVSQLRASLRQSSLQQLEFDTGAKAQRLETFLQGLREDLLSLSRIDAVQQLADPTASREAAAETRAQAERELLRFAQGRKAYCGVRCLNVAGNELLRLDVENGVPFVASPRDLSDRVGESEPPWAQAAEPGGIDIDIDITRAALEDEARDPHHRGIVRYTTPLVTPAGPPYATLTINICIGHLLSMLGPLPSGVEAWLLDERGTYLGYFGESEEHRDRYDFDRARTLADDYTSQQVETILQQQDPVEPLEVADRFLSHTSIALDPYQPDRRWTLLIARPLAPLEAPITRMTSLFASLVALLVGLTAITGVFVGRYLARPVARLRSATREIAAGDLSQRVEIATGDELEGLAHDFNTMTERLEQAQQRLAQWNEELEREVNRQTERVRTLQSGLARTDKLASLGQMTAGVLHEVGNPLASLKTKIQVAQEEAEPCDSCRSLLPELLAEVDRLTMFLRSFSRMARLPDPLMEPVSPADIIQGLTALVTPELGRRGCTLRIDLEEDLPLISGDANQLRQLLINLVLNAAEASQAGEIVIRCEQTEFPHRPGTAAVALRVIDNGSGIAPEILAKVWDPFFSTKSQGTGLGLAICRQIAVEHGGTIDLKSRPGGGTQVTLILPALTDSDEPVSQG